MIVGGAEKSLINFLRAIDSEKYDVTLFTLNDKGAYFDEIPDNIHIQFTACANTGDIFRDDLRHLRILQLAKGIYYRIMVRASRDEYKKFFYSVCTYPKMEGHFDCAISYKLAWADMATTVRRINADKKCGWMHSNVDEEKKRADKFMPWMLSAVQKVFCVSENCREQLRMHYPDHSQKFEVIHNLVDIAQIREKAEENRAIKLKSISLVTVGRLSSEKGQQMVPETVRILLDAGYDIHWYLVGDGSLRGEIEERCRQLGVEERVSLLGTQVNPYPYMKECDIYVQTSFSEGWCLTVQEARILHKPIVTTNFPVMREQIVSGENGLIVDDMTPQALADGIKTLIDHPQLREKFVKNLEKENFSNEAELQKLYDFIEN